MLDPIESNLFSEISQQHLLAYIDDLAKISIGAANSFAVVENPFAQRFAFLRRELSRCKAKNELLLQERQANALNTATARTIIKLTNAAQATAQSSQPEQLYRQIILNLNGKLIWLIGKFQLSTSCEIFVAQSALTELMPEQAKRMAWELYLAAINVCDMGEILACCQEGLAELSRLPAALRPYFAVIEDLDNYFKLVIKCLDSLAAADTEPAQGQKDKESALMTAVGNYFGATASQPHQYFKSLANACAELSEKIVLALRQRIELFQALLTIVCTALPSREDQKITELLQQESPLADYVYASKI